MAETGDKEQVVTPWEAKAGKGQSRINYDKLISKFELTIAVILASINTSTIRYHYAMF